jgi:hypothetical protein
VLHDILGHYDTDIDHRTDGDRDPGERNHICIDARPFHRDKREQYRNRQEQRNEYRAAQVYEQHKHHEHRDQDFLPDGII